MTLKINSISILILCVLSVYASGLRIISPFSQPLVYNYSCSTFQSYIFSQDTHHLAEIPASQLLEYWGTLVFHDLPTLNGSFIYGDKTKRTRSRGKIGLTAYDVIPLSHLQDVTGIETVQLYSLYTLLVYEHNRHCDILHEADTRRSDETLYDLARKIVVALIQKITFDDWLPYVLGKDRIIQPHSGRKPTDPTSMPDMVVEFEYSIPAIFRVMSSNRVLYSDQNKELSEIALENGFNSPNEIHRVLGGVDGTCTVITGMFRDPLYKLQPYALNALKDIDYWEDACDLLRSNDVGGLPTAQQLVPVLRTLVPAPFSTDLPVTISTLDDITTDSEKQDIIRSLFAFGTLDSEIVHRLDLLTTIIMEDHGPDPNDIMGPIGRALVYYQMVNRTRDRDQHWHEISHDRRDQTGLTKRQYVGVKRSSISEIVHQNCEFIDENDHSLAPESEFLLWAVSDVDIMVVEQSNLDKQNIGMLIALTVAICVFVSLMFVIFFVLRKK